MGPQTRKADDLQVIGLNAAGLGLKAIGRRLGIHHTTVAHRLKVLKVPAAETRRGFMDEIFESLSADQQAWLMGRLGPGHGIKDFVRTLLVREYVSSRNPQ